MTNTRIEIVSNAASFLAARRDEFLHDRSLPLSVRGCASVHFEKPWIPNFWSVAIRAPRAGSESAPPPTRDPSYFDFSIGRDQDGSPWYFPSRKWWEAHAKASHPGVPPGSGCDVDVHTKFLSSEGSVHEFDYATILTDGRMAILGQNDFEKECRFWSLAFGKR